MGVPAPLTAPTLANNNAGSGTAEDHVYVITYVSAFSGIEEEGPPSPPVTAAAWQPGDTITVTRTDTAPATHPNILYWRVYRSNGSELLYVKQVAIATTSTTDDLLNTDLGEGISTTDFDPPPDDMIGIVAMANGILAGFRSGGNEVCFSEPYQPHAWPARYRQAVNEVVVALVAVGQGLYILTDGNPYFGSGNHPEAITLERINKFAPCQSKRTAASDGVGAMYASYNGVSYAKGATVESVTGTLFTQEEWDTYKPSTMHGVFYDGRYILWSEVSGETAFTMDGRHAMDGAQIMDGTANESLGALVFNTNLQGVPLTYLRTNTPATHIRPDTGLLYMLLDGYPAKFDAQSIVNATYEYRSKLFVLPRPVVFKYIQVYADYNIDPRVAGAIESAEEKAIQEQAILEANEDVILAGGHNGGWGMVGINQLEWNGSLLEERPFIPDPLTLDYTAHLTVRVYMDGELVYYDLSDSNEEHPLPGGLKSDTWEIEVVGNRPCRRVVLGTSIEDLRTA